MIWGCGLEHIYAAVMSDYYSSLDLHDVCSELGWTWRGKETVQAGMPPKDVWRYMPDKVNQTV